MKLPASRSYRCKDVHIGVYPIAAGIGQLHMYTKNILNFNHRNLASFSRVKLTSKQGSLKCGFREGEGCKNIILQVSALQCPKYLLQDTIGKQILSKTDHI